MSDPKISIIVPCYNAEKFLPRCLDSLVNQTLPDIEIICVNDASPDNGIAILRDYEARYPNIRVIDLKENVRQGGARNRGMEIARGEYIGFVDSDDWVEPDMYEKLYTKAKETRADFVCCDYDEIKPDKTVLRTVYTNENIKGLVKESDRKKLIENSLGVVWNGIYKTETLNKYSIRFPEKVFYEDNYFRFAHSLYTGHYEHIPFCLYHYCQNEVSTTHKIDIRKINDLLTVYDRMAEHFPQKEFAKKYSPQFDIVTYRMLNNTLGIYLGSFQKIDLAVLKEIHRRMRSIRDKTSYPRYYSAAQRRHLRIFLSSPRLYLSIWKAKRLLKKLIK